MRRAAHLILLLLFLGLVGATVWSLPAGLPVDLFLRIDPLVQVQAAIASRVWPVAGGAALLLLGCTLLFGRFFCGWVCPLGTCLEIADDLAGRNRRRSLGNSARRLRWLKYALLAAVAGAALLGQGLAWLLDPIVWATRIVTLALWPLLSSAAGVALSVLAPLLDAAGLFDLARTPLGRPLFGWHGLAAVSFLGLLLLLGRWQRRFWCRSLCPLGGLLALPARVSLFQRKVSEACDRCSACARACETGAIRDDFATFDPAECIQCGRCVDVCHSRAVSFVPAAWQQRRPAFDLSRRRVVAGTAAGVLAGSWFSLSPSSALTDDRALRPPGALPEGRFLAACVRCGQCVKACPTTCLQPALAECGPAGLLSPVAAMRLGPCDQNCSACGQVCPTGAIRPLPPVEKRHAAIGGAVLDRERCIAWSGDRACLVCDENCPYGAIRWEEHEGGRRPVVEPERCNGCGQCETACPIEGSSAIRVMPEGQIRLAEGSYLTEAARRGRRFVSRPSGYP